MNCRTRFLMAQVWFHGFHYWYRSWNLSLTEGIQSVNLLSLSAQPSAHQVTHGTEKTHSCSLYIVHLPTCFRLFAFDSFSSSYFHFHTDKADSSRSISFSKDKRILNRTKSEIVLQFKNNFRNAFNFRFSIFLISDICIWSLSWQKTFF